ncbi:hypothetical protein FFLO_04506 [Filobasidium floriforme]|uniref:K Homology domain-containing protein n=1 Tax=Filobasidium floriforme TaxID=5210 RepID=A0A8K0NMA9_9TREE|nr:uncharacterized protein HD553DRAFT_330538 [Filobasidium floriforme]KAG7531264.1 hypothetical protein FFLO_04506 [Filobasidium floriforme]KAH8089681.1 hypothetical protein HD553DRAFT_330538 [Filobasidium floriforme]
MADIDRKRKWDDEPEQKPTLDAAAQAAAVAARIASMHGAGSGSGSPSTAVKEEKKDLYDGAFTHNIDINDLRNRYLITKGSTQQEIATETGASITTKGVWLPDRSKAAPNEEPLYLHIAAPSQTVLDTAIKRVNELIDADLGPLVEDRSRFAKNRERYFEEGRQGGERKKWPEEKLPIGLESMRNFNVRAKVVGPGGMFVKYIQAETGTRVQIKGLGSGFIENDTGREAEEPMHVFISGPDERQLVAAKELAEDLLTVVREEHAKAIANMQMNMGMGGGYGGHHGGGGYQHQQGGAGGYQQQGQGGYGGYAGYQQQQQPPLPGATPNGAEQAQGTPGVPVMVDGMPDKTDTSGTYEAWKGYWAQMGYDVEDTAFRTWLKGHMAAGNDIYGQPPAGAAAATAAAAGGATGGSAS